MITTHRNALLASSLLLLAATTVARAFTIPWNCFHNGTRASGGAWSANSTIGQPALGRASGGSYLMDTGYERGAAVPPPVCLGDSNGDDLINTTDLVFFLGRFGQTVSPGSPADLNNDGIVNTVDLVRFLGRFGQSCL